MNKLTSVNVVIFGAQVLLVVAAAAVGVIVCRVSSARTRLAYWRGAILACLLSPLVPVRAAHLSSVTPAGTQASTGFAASIASIQAPTFAFAAIVTAIPWILLFGAAVRAAWLGLGFIRLRQLRLDGTPIVAGTHHDLEALRRAIAPRAELRWNDHIAQPLTFGLRWPVVLLPRRVGDLQPDARRAIACHELFHVARHDWVWLITEEIVRTAFWFHPAMLWALGQVQLSREQTVDEMVVTVTAARVPYMNALMMFADARPGFASALPFVRRRQLTSRLEQLSEEHTMSSLRLAFTSVALAGVLIGSSFAVAYALPLRPRAGGAQEPTTKRVPKVVKQTRPEYPAGMKDYGIGAEVAVNVDVSAAGDVTGVHFPSFTIKVPGDASKEVLANAGPLFFDATESAAREWKFEPADSDTSAEILFTFTTTPDADVKDGVQGGVTGGISNGVTGGIAGGVHGPLRVGGPIKPPIKIHNVAPIYPDDAKAAHVAGVVIIEVTIAKDGSVSDARILRSVPMLDLAALDAVRQWIFTPTLLNGIPVELVMTTTVNFTPQ